MTFFLILFWQFLLLLALFSSFSFQVFFFIHGLWQKLKTLTVSLKNPEK